MQQFAALFISSVLSMLVMACTSPEERVREILIDNSELLLPEKADLKDIKRGNFVGNTVWCGQINPRNALGARTGWGAFYIIDYKDREPNVTILEGLRYSESDDELRAAGDAEARRIRSRGRWT